MDQRSCSRPMYVLWIN